MDYKIIDSIEDLDRHRDAWEGLRLENHSSVFCSFDLVRLWLDTYRGIAQPRIIVVEDRDSLVGLAPMSMQRSSAMGLQIRTLTMVGKGKGVLGYSLLSVMARNDDDAIISELVRGIEESDWNLMQLYALNPTPSTTKLLEKLRASFEWQPYAEVSNLFYEFPKEGEVSARFGSSNRRILKKIRLGLEREGRMQVRTASSVEEAEAAMRLYAQQHTERWAKRGGSMFSDETNVRHLVGMGKLAVRTGTGVIHELLIDGEVAAQSLTLFDGDLARGFRIGMIDKFKEFSPGKLLMLLVMEDLHARGFRGYDLLSGDEGFKHQMMTHARTLPSIQILRGSLNVMSKVRNFAPVRRLDERLKLRDRVLKRMNDD